LQRELNSKPAQENYIKELINQANLN
jgi:hypothetical protein